VARRALPLHGSLVPKLQLGNAPALEAPASFSPEVVLLSNSHRQDACATKRVAVGIATKRENEAELLVQAHSQAGAWEREKTGRRASYSRIPTQSVGTSLCRDTARRAPACE